jgi:hypothetical protein
MKTKYLVYLMFTFLIFTTTNAQINPVYKTMRQRGWKPLTTIEKTELTQDKMRNEFLVSMGYNDTVISNLKGIGVDFETLNTPYTFWNEKVLTAFCDCVVIGTVKRKEYTMEKDAFFHTIAYVQVEEFLRNDYNIPISQIPVMIVSGPISSDIMKIQENEDTLSIDEQVLLFLSANSIIRMANDNNYNHLYNQLINDSIIRFKIIAKYRIEDGNLIGRDGIKDFNNVKADINTANNAIR